MEPTEQQLEKIFTWDANDLHGLMAYIKPLWRYADSGYWKEENGVYSISTAGMSDNEEIIEYMSSNIIWWLMFWQQSRRGGHYIFCKCGEATVPQQNQSVESERG